MYTYTYASGSQYNPAATDFGARQAPRRRSKKRVVRAVLLLLAVVLGLGLYFGYDNLARLTGNRNPFQLFGAFREVELQQTSGRTNILLAGYSVDDPGHSGAELTDSIMVISIDKANGKATIISIPRDLWVKIPGYGYSKINAAYPNGENSKFNEAGYFGGGMGLLQKVVEQNLGIDIHYYGLINYAAFKQAVDAVGGITIDLTSTDNPYGLYDPYANLKLPNSTVKLDGQTALNVARARGDGPGAYGFPRGDFNRTQHQRQMLVALNEKATSAGVLANPIRAGQLVSAAGDNVRTNLSLAEIQTVASIGKTIPQDAITSVGLNDINKVNYLQNYTSPNGQSALIPATGLDRFGAIQDALDLLLSSPAQNTTTGQ